MAAEATNRGKNPSTSRISNQKNHLIRNRRTSPLTARPDYTQIILSHPAHGALPILFNPVIPVPISGSKKVALVAEPNKFSRQGRRELFRRTFYCFSASE